MIHSVPIPLNRKQLRSNRGAIARRIACKLISRVNRFHTHHAVPSLHYRVDLVLEGTVYGKQQKKWKANKTNPAEKPDRIQCLDEASRVRQPVLMGLDMKPAG